MFYYNTNLIIKGCTQYLIIGAIAIAVHPAANIIITIQTGAYLLKGYPNPLVCINKLTLR